MRPIAVLLLGLIAVVMTTAMVVKKNSVTVPAPAEETELVRHYRGMDGVEVYYVKDYRVDDSTFVDVTVIMADDSIHFEKLMQEVNVQELIRVKMRKAHLDKDNYVVSFYYAEKGHPENHIRSKSDTVDFVFISGDDYTVYVFDITSKEQGNIIQENHTRKQFHLTNT